MLTKRQEIILKIIVDEHIKTASPVGSKRIQEVLEIEISSATIRNESSILEEKEFLEKAHTSSGRIPSSKGYRYYIDNLMDENDFIDAKKEIEAIFSKRNIKIEQVLEEASNILGELTNLASVISTTNQNESDLLFSKVELIRLSEEKAKVIFILSDGSLEHINYETKNVSLKELEIAIELFNERLINSKISEIEMRLLAIEPILKKHIKHYDFVLQTFISTLIHTSSNKSKTVGMQYLLQNPEFNDPTKIKEIITFIENSSPLEWFKSQTFKGVANVAIGLEIGNNSDDLAVIGTEFNTGKEKTSLTLVGPKRIQYNKVSELLDYIKLKIEEQFGKGE